MRDSSSCFVSHAYFIPFSDLSIESELPESKWNFI